MSSRQPGTEHTLKTRRFRHMDAPGTAILYSWGRTGLSICTLNTHCSWCPVNTRCSCIYQDCFHLSGLFLGRFQPVYYSILIIAIPEFLLTQTFMIFCYHILLWFPVFPALFTVSDFSLFFLSPVISFCTAAGPKTPRIRRRKAGRAPYNPGFPRKKALLRIVKASHCRKKRLEFRTGLKSNNYYIK